jgi:DnaJ-class molecular chaperone
VHFFSPVASLPFILMEEDLSLDPYAVLNVSKDATEEEIRRSYHELSRGLHPDKQRPSRTLGRVEMAVPFNTLNKAYHALSDPVTREAYDAGGWSALRTLMVSVCVCVCACVLLLRE